MMLLPLDRRWGQDFAHYRMGSLQHSPRHPAWLLAEAAFVCIIL